MNVQEIYELLGRRFVEIQLHNSLIESLVREELTRLSENRKAISEAGYSTDSPYGRSVQSMIFQTLKTGTLISYGFDETDIEGRARRTAEHKNRQYGWLLVEAYEELSVSRDLWFGVFCEAPLILCRRPLSVFVFPAAFG